MRLKIIINSTIAFIIAAIVETILHEGGHFVASIAMGVPSELHHNYVRHAESTPNVHILFSLAGPVVSLLIGIIFQLLLNRKTYKGMTALVMLYMSFFGYIGFLGYMCIAPFFSYGDTGFVLRAIGTPMWLIIFLAVVSAFVAFLVGKALAVHFIGLMSRQTSEDAAQRRRFIYSLVFLPLFSGIALTTLLNLPVPTPLSLIAPLTSPFMILWAFGYYLKSPGISYDEEERIDKKVSIGWMAVMILIVIINRLLVAGISG
jgi:hypothetical protein